MAEYVVIAAGDAGPPGPPGESAFVTVFRLELPGWVGNRLDKSFIAPFAGRIEDFVICTPAGSGQPGRDIEVGINNVTAQWVASGVILNHSFLSGAANRLHEASSPLPIAVNEGDFISISLVAVNQFFTASVFATIFVKFRPS